MKMYDPAGVFISVEDIPPRVEAEISPLLQEFLFINGERFDRKDWLGILIFPVTFLEGWGGTFKLKGWEEFVLLFPGASSPPYRVGGYPSLRDWDGRPAGA